MSARDDFEGPTLLSAGERFYVITPSDTTDLPVKTKGILCSQTGTVMADGDPDALVTTTDVPIPVVAGALYPLRVTRVRATGTTAGTIIGVF